MIATGRVFQLVALVFIVVVIYYAVHMTKRGRKFKLRSIAGLDAIPEAVGRATEMGGTVVVIPGIGGLVGGGLGGATEAAETLAGLSVLGYTTSLVAKYGAKIVAGICKPEVMPLAEETVKQAFLAAGKPQDFKPEMVRFLSGDQWGVATAIMGILQREKVAANIMIGYFAGEALALAESAAAVGAIQVAGTATNIGQNAWFATICDYVLIGDEVYAAGAILSQDPEQIGTLAGQDVPKLLAIGLVAIGTVLGLLKSNILLDILKR